MPARHTEGTCLQLLRSTESSQLCCNAFFTHFPCIVAINLLHGLHSKCCNLGYIFYSKCCNLGYIFHSKCYDLVLPASLPHQGIGSAAWWAAESDAGSFEMVRYDSLQNDMTQYDVGWHRATSSWLILVWRHSLESRWLRHKRQCSFGFVCTSIGI
jgi:hypothetical protein